MKRLKLAIALLLCLVLGLVQSSLVFAEKNDVEEEVIAEYEEIKDPKLLLERAKAGITDADTTKVKKVKPKAVSKNIETGEEMNHETYETTQLLKITKDKKTGKTSKHYATTVIALASYTQSVNTNEDPEFASGYTGDVAAYSTIYYKDINDQNGVTHTQLYKTTGYWDILTGNIALSSPKVSSKTWGPSSFTSSSWVSNLTYSIPTSQLFYPGFIWSYTNLRPVLQEVVWNIASQTEVTVKRGTSSWVLKLGNALNGQSIW